MDSLKVLAEISGGDWDLPENVGCEDWDTWSSDVGDHLQGPVWGWPDDETVSVPRSEGTSQYMLYRAVPPGDNVDTSQGLDAAPNAD